MIMSFPYEVEIVVAGVFPLPLAVPGSDVLGSKGLLKLAPATPKARRPLYSPPYWVLAQPDIVSVIVSEVNGLELFA